MFQPNILVMKISCKILITVGCYTFLAVIQQPINLLLYSAINDRISFIVTNNSPFPSWYLLSQSRFNCNEGIVSLTCHHL